MNKREFYYRKAKAENFRSRACYKLFQAVKKYHFIKPGYVVVDLGAAPGGWTQTVIKLTKDSGFVLAVDVKTITNFKESNVLSIIGDITEEKTIENILRFLPRSADVVVSDVSPNISGIWELDHERQIDLASHSLKIATSVLRPGGNFFVKIFQGRMINEFIKKTKENFSFLKLVKPKASRPKSAEIYLLGMNFKQKK
jgi:23S rRNA (uridine2552-2'-O)-methyltransferase